MKKRHMEYEVALVTYIDILGFRELVETKTAGDISRIIRIVKETVQPYRFKTKLERTDNENFVNFSDLSITSVPLRRRSQIPRGRIFWQLMHLIHAQSSLIFDESIVIRGGVTVGKIAKSYGQLYGPAVVRAYELESQIARYPRIIVGREVFEELDDNAGLWVHDHDTEIEGVHSLLREGDDGQFYVDYLRVMREELLEHYDAFLSHHQSLIAERLERYSTNANVRFKYEWMDHYQRSTLIELERTRNA